MNRTKAAVLRAPNLVMAYLERDGAELIRITLGNQFDIASACRRNKSASNATDCSCNNLVWARLT